MNHRKISGRERLISTPPHTIGIALDLEVPTEVYAGVDSSRNEPFAISRSLGQLVIAFDRQGCLALIEMLQRYAPGSEPEQELIREALKEHAGL
jgi:hypothetical protein